MTQLYLLPCGCGQKVRITTAQAGDQVRCVCGKSLSVPTLRGIRQLEIAPPEGMPQAESSWSLLQGIFFSSGLFIAAAAIVFLAFFGLRYAQLGASGYTRDITDFAVKAESARIDKLTPLQALKEWTDDVTEGLGQPEEPPWIKANKIMAGYRGWIKGSVIALITGTLLSAAALLLSRR